MKLFLDPHNMSWRIFTISRGALVKLRKREENKERKTLSAVTGGLFLISCFDMKIVIVSEKKIILSSSVNIKNF